MEIHRPNGNSSANNGKGGNGKNKTTETTESVSTEDTTSVATTTASSTTTGNGNATNAETNNSQNQSDILFPIDSETSDTEEYLIGLIKTTGKEKNYELIEYINDVNREYTEVLVEQNINGADDTTYVYGVDRLSLDRFDGSTGYYLYDPRGSVTGITNVEGQIYQSYRYNANGEITFGAPEYENEYTYNGESYNPNIESQYLRARYYDVTIAAFITEDSYLGDITEPLTLNRYNYCVSSPLNYVDKSGHWVEEDIAKTILDDPSIAQEDKGYEIYKRVQFYKSLISVSFEDANYDYVMGFDYEGNQEYFDDVINQAEKMNKENSDYVDGGDITKLAPGTGYISSRGAALLITYESLGEEYEVRDEAGNLVAILSRDVEGEGNITFGYGILFKNTEEDRKRLADIVEQIYTKKACILQITSMTKTKRIKILVLI